MPLPMRLSARAGSRGCAHEDREEKAKANHRVSVAGLVRASTKQFGNSGFGAGSLNSGMSLCVSSDGTDNTGSQTAASLVEDTRADGHRWADSRPEFDRARRNRNGRGFPKPEAAPARPTG